MADELQYSSRSDNKRKYDSQTTPPPPPSSGPRRPTGFSAPISSQSPESNHSAGSAPSYNNVPPPMDEIQLAKQRAQEIAARLFSNAEAKRPRLENGAPIDDENKGFSSSAPSDYGQKSYGQHLGQGGMGGSGMGYGFQGSSKRIEIPNGRVGVIIGKSGETIKYLQVQSGAKIQVTRDVDADINSNTRTVELMGTSEQISKAEQLINGVLSQAEAGGSNLVSRRFSGQGGGEQFQMKVGLIIGKGGETIKNMQANSGARIQLIPLHLPPGDVSTERTVYIDGTTEQIEAAKQLVNEVISEATIICFNVRCWIPLFAVEQYMVLDSFYIYIPVGILPNLIIVGTPMFPLFDVVDSCLKVTLFRVVPGDSVHDDFDIMSGLDNRKEIGLSGDSQAFIERIYKVFSQFFLTLLDIGEGIGVCWRKSNSSTSTNRVRNPGMGGGYNQQGYRAPQSHGWGPPGPPSTQAGYGYMQPGAYPGQPPQYNMPQQPYTGYPPQQASSGWDQSGVPPSQQTTQGSGYDYYSQQPPSQQPPPQGGSSTPADNSGYNYNKPQAASYNQQQGSYGGSGYSQPPGGQQRGYGQDGYGAGYQSQASQYGQPQAGYDQSHGYNAASTYGTGVSPAQDGAGTAYGAQGGSSSLPPPQQALQSGQPPATAQPGYASQQPNTPPSYPAQGPQAGYPPTSQPGYGSQPPAQAGYGQSAPVAQPNYGPPQGQKPPAQAAYGQTQPPSSQAAYPGYAHSQPLPTQPASAQPDSSIPRPPSSGYGSGAPQAGYAQQPYGTQAGYAQQQSYGEAYSGGYSQPPVYPNDSNAGGSAHGSYDAAAGAQSVQQTGTVAKASPQS
ncbi:hypothetical protein Scep_008208 [Stephania cephalantha]|uniref:K Homology domain-containing protein n=1 Tax=Stephania cephalantha TaxID=152367 RepID=A0AAP0KB89_9MAGN